jgi:hypothetical protein
MPATPDRAIPVRQKPYVAVPAAPHPFFCPEARLDKGSDRKRLPDTALFDLHQEQNETYHVFGSATVALVVRQKPTPGGLYS